MELYFYNVGYHSYEECPKTILSHTNCYTKEEFNNIIFECLSKTIAEHAITEEDYYDTFGDFLDEIVLLLVSDYGFNYLNYTATFNPFGWASIYDVNDWKSETGKDLDLEFLRTKFNKTI